MTDKRFLQIRHSPDFEQRDVRRDTLEENAMIRAIQEGEKTPRISRKHIFQQLGKAA